MLLCVGCQKSTPKLQIIKSELIPEIPSASGMVAVSDGFYLVGDDSPYLFRLNNNNELLSKQEIHSTKYLKNGRIPKINKPDFEALELINPHEIVAIGSGSKSPERELFLRILIKDSIEVKTYQISQFYTLLREHAALHPEELNIEALAFKNGYLHLFNRGKNMIFSFVYRELLAYFDGNRSYPKPKITSFDLPKINGINSGFSGATCLQDHPIIIFTSSVENTKSTYDDGEILGSFVGKIDLINDQVSDAYDAELVPFSGNKIKVEAVTVVKESRSRKVSLVLATDNDDGNSLKIDCVLEWQK